MQHALCPEARADAMSSATRSRARTIATALFAIALGALILAGTGFAQSAVFHDTAHDGRHSFNFPCH